MTETASEDIHALLAVEFKEVVDKISRAMFAGKMLELGWLVTPVANTWQLVFEPRSRASMRDTTAHHVDIATAYARVEPNAVAAVAHFGSAEPELVTKATE